MDGIAPQFFPLNYLIPRQIIISLELKNQIKMGVAELTGDDPSDERCRTYVFEGEGHTLGNALRSVISRYPEVTFCGYTVPHPAEDKINFRIQTSGPKAIDILKRGLSDLEEHCKFIMESFKEAVSNFNTS